MGTSAPSPCGEKNPNWAKSWGTKKGQIFPQYTLLLRLHHHPTAKKIQIRKNLGASKRVKFSLSIHFCYVCTITLRRKKSKFGKILGHQKMSNFPSVYTFATSAPSPYGEKNPNSAKSWGIKKGQIFPQYTLLLRLHHHPTAKKSKFGKILGHQKGSNFPSVYTFATSAPSPYGEKIQIRQNLGASKRVKFSLSIHFCYVCTITLRRKKSKFGKILGHQKGSNFP